MINKELLSTVLDIETAKKYCLNHEFDFIENISNCNPYTSEGTKKICKNCGFGLKATTTTYGSKRGVSRDEFKWEYEPKDEE